MKKNNRIILYTVLALLLPLMAFKLYNSNVEVSVEKKWESEKTFKVPESVCYDSKNEMIYVANIEGKPSEKDYRGFISKLSPEGKIVKLEWVKEISAPKGMGIYNNRLYVSDINEVVEIDIRRGRILSRYKAAGAKFLNDISIAPDGTIFISDSHGNKIYVLKNGKVNVWLDNERLDNPNGLYVENKKLLIGIKNSVLSVDIKTKDVKTYIKNTGGIDGLVPDEQGNYLISDWSGKVHLISPGKEKVLLFDTTSDKINAADIDYIKDRKLLLVPTFFDNRVVAYTVK